MAKRTGRGASAGKKAGTCAAASMRAPAWMLIAAFSILAVLALVLAFRYAYASKQQTQKQHKEGYSSDSVHKQKKQKQKQLVFLYMDGCGWCERFKPQWDAFSATYGAPLSERGLELLAVERKDPRAAAFGQVDGYPTVLLVTPSSGESVKFAGDRTPEGLVAFLGDHGVVVRVTEGYYEEPQTEFGSVHSTVGGTKSSQDGKFAGQQSAMQKGAGGNLQSTSA